MTIHAELWLGARTTPPGEEKEERPIAVMSNVDSTPLDLGHEWIVLSRIFPAWFWTPEWQEGEAEADEDLAAGRVTVYHESSAFLDALSKLDEAI